MNHMENHIVASIGFMVGLRSTDVMRAAGDKRAKQRFKVFQGDQLHKGTLCVKKFFDVRAMLGVFVAEVNSFGEASSPNSLARLFLDWVAVRATHNHLVFDTD